MQKISAASVACLRALSSATSQLLSGRVELQDCVTSNLKSSLCATACHCCLPDIFCVRAQVVVDRGANPYLTKIECWEHDRLITKARQSLHVVRMSVVNIAPHAIGVCRSSAIVSPAQC